MRRADIAQIKFTRHLLDHRRNNDILNELRVDPVEKKLTRHRQK